MPKETIKSLMLSDTHLFSLHSNVDLIVDFFSSMSNKRIDSLYLLGDIFDIWSLRVQAQKQDGLLQWSKFKNIIRLLIHMSDNGTRIIYVTGNHDDMLRNISDKEMSGYHVELVDQALYASSDNKYYVMFHGDQLDSFVRYFRALSVFGTMGYQTVLKMNSSVNVLRNKLGLAPWSLSDFMKKMDEKDYLNTLSKFRDKAIELGKSVSPLMFDGVICGHTHAMSHVVMENGEYWNCGSWTGEESVCSYIIDEGNGLSLRQYPSLKWTQEPDNRERCGKPQTTSDLIKNMNTAQEATKNSKLRFP